jgi:triosephosphate isomerase (TIM)
MGRVDMRKKFIAGNWKMYTTGGSAEALAAAVAKGVGGDTTVMVAVCPPFPFLARVAQALKGTPVALGAQNCYPEKEGAFTGEVSPLMLLDVGCRYVILGHSERRQVLRETDAFINRKVHAALEAGLDVILCVGETLAEREANHTEQVLDVQLRGSLANIPPGLVSRITIAYEPVWAIGTGKTATPDQAQHAHAYIRQRIAQAVDADTARALTIQYGGSVKPENAASLLTQPDVDGALVGGASLKPEQFLPIIKAAQEAR